MLKAVKTMPDRVSRMSPRLLAAVLAVLCLGLSACADSRPPTGRWEGLYEDAGVIIVARLEIADNGRIRVSAPNAITGEQPLSPAERASVVQQLQARLAMSWPAVEPLPLEFDGHAFRKPGGVAPQLEWDAARKRMTMIYYSGNRSSVRVALTSVGEFGASKS
jgi:hypothetical protein